MAGSALNRYLAAVSAKTTSENSTSSKLKPASSTSSKPTARSNFVVAQLRQKVAIVDDDETDSTTKEHQPQHSIPSSSRSTPYLNNPLIARWKMEQQEETVAEEMITNVKEKQTTDRIQSDATKDNILHTNYLSTPTNRYSRPAGHLATNDSQVVVTPPRNVAAIDEDDISVQQLNCTNCGHVVLVASPKQSPKHNNNKLPTDNKNSMRMFTLSPNEEESWKQRLQTKNISKYPNPAYPSSIPPETKKHFSLPPNINNVHSSMNRNSATQPQNMIDTEGSSSITGANRVSSFLKPRKNNSEHEMQQHFNAVSTNRSVHRSVEEQPKSSVYSSTVSGTGITSGFNNFSSGKTPNFGIFSQALHNNSTAANHLAVPPTTATTTTTTPHGVNSSENEQPEGYTSVKDRKKQLWGSNEKSLRAWQTSKEGPNAKHTVASDNNGKQSSPHSTNLNNRVASVITPEKKQNIHGLTIQNKAEQQQQSSDQMILRPSIQFPAETSNTNNVSSSSELTARLQQQRELLDKLRSQQSFAVVISPEKQNNYAEQQRQQRALLEKLRPNTKIQADVKQPESTKNVEKSSGMKKNYPLQASKALEKPKQLNPILPESSTTSGIPSIKERIQAFQQKNMQANSNPNPNNNHKNKIGQSPPRFLPVQRDKYSPNDAATGVILSQQTVSSGRQMCVSPLSSFDASSASYWNDEANFEEEGNSSSDEEETVSTLTNPTFSGSVASYQKSLSSSKSLEKRNAVIKKVQSTSDNRRTETTELLAEKPKVSIHPEQTTHKTAISAARSPATPDFVKRARALQNNRHISPFLPTSHVSEQNGVQGNSRDANSHKVGNAFETMIRSDKINLANGSTSNTEKNKENFNLSASGNNLLPHPQEATTQYDEEMMLKGELRPENLYKLGRTMEVAADFKKRYKVWERAKANSSQTTTKNRTQQNVQNVSEINRRRSAIERNELKVQPNALFLASTVHQQPGRTTQTASAPLSSQLPPLHPSQKSPSTIDRQKKASESFNKMRERFNQKHKLSSYRQRKSLVAGEI